MFRQFTVGAPLHLKQSPHNEGRRNFQRKTVWIRRKGGLVMIAGMVLSARVTRIMNFANADFSVRQSVLHNEAASMYGREEDAESYDTVRT